MMNTTAVMPTPDLGRQHHPGCVVCSPECARGLRLQFHLDDRGAAIASFPCTSDHEGYPGLLHGGITSTILDGAMTNCLFLHGHVALTAELTVRFRHPVQLGVPVEVRAWIVEARPPIFRLSSQLVQGGVVKATARAAFMEPATSPRLT